MKNIEMVGLGGLEPPTSPLSGVRSNQLIYRPIFTLAFNLKAVQKRFDILRHLENKLCGRFESLEHLY